MFIATLIADDLAPGDIAEARDRLADAGCVPGPVSWIDEGAACDIAITANPVEVRAAIEAMPGALDVVVQAAEGREKRLLVSDMDSTMITVECIDELADYAGLRAEVSDVTERAMRGELDFEAALDARVALLAGMPVATLEACRAERVVLMPGAEALVRTLRARGGFAVLVSGGFTHFAEPVAAMIGFDRSVSNILGIGNGLLDGTVTRPVVGAEAKRAALIAAMRERGLGRAETLAVGDGANDIPMLEEAGLGVAYRAKAAAAKAADAHIRHGDLTALLHAQGIARRDWIRA